LFYFIFFLSLRSLSTSGTPFLIFQIAFWHSTSKIYLLIVLQTGSSKSPVVKYTYQVILSAFLFLNYRIEFMGLGLQGAFWGIWHPVSGLNFFTQNPSQPSRKKVCLPFLLPFPDFDKEESGWDFSEPIYCEKVRKMSKKDEKSGFACLFYYLFQILTKRDPAGK
jgi:hypothetical protein